MTEAATLETASWARRILALFVDWFASSFVVVVILGPSRFFADQSTSPDALPSLLTLLVFVLETAALLGARSYDAKGAEFTHQHLPEGEICSFVTLMRSFDLWGKDPALDMVGKIVNHADTSRETAAYKMREGDGLEAIARGFAAITTDDH